MVLIVGGSLLLLVGFSWRVGLLQLSLVNPDLTTLVAWSLLLFYGSLTLLGFNESLFYAVGPILKSELQYPLCPELIAQIAFCSGIALICGLFLGKVSWKKLTYSRRSNWQWQPIISTGCSDVVDKWFWFIFAGALLLTIYYISYIGGLGRLPLYQMLTGVDSQTIIMERERCFKHLPQFYAYLFHSLRILVYPFLLCFSYVTLRTKGRSIKTIARLAASFIFSVGFNSSSSALGPALELFIQVGFCEVLLHRIRVRRMILAGVAILFILMVVHHVMIVTTSGQDVKIIDSVSSLLEDQIIHRGHGYVIDSAIFTNVYAGNPVGISGIPKLALLFDKPVRMINNELFLALIPNAKVKSGYYNGPWFLYDFTYWGLWGVVWGSLCFGFMLSFFNRYFYSFPKDRVVVSFMGMAIVGAWGAFDTPVSTWLFSQGGAIGVISLFVLRNFLGLYKEKRRLGMLYGMPQSNINETPGC